MTIDDPLQAAHGDPAQAPVQWQGRFIAVQKTRAGWEFVTRTSGPLAVVICGLTPAGEVLLVEQYRECPVAARSWNFQPGLVGDVPGERVTADAASGDVDEVLATAQRELEEECGFVAENVELLAMGPVSAGLTDETLCIVRATGLRQVGVGGGVAGEEAITAHPVMPEELPAFVSSDKQQAWQLISNLILAWRRWVYRRCGLRRLTSSIPLWAPLSTPPVAQHGAPTRSWPAKMLEIALLFLRFLPPNLKRDHRTALGPEFRETPS